MADSLKPIAKARIGVHSVQLHNLTREACGRSAPAWKCVEAIELPQKPKRLSRGDWLAVVDCGADLCERYRYWNVPLFELPIGKDGGYGQAGIVGGRQDHDFGAGFKHKQFNTVEIFALSHIIL